MPIFYFFIIASTQLVLRMVRRIGRFQYESTVTELELVVSNRNWSESEWNRQSHNGIGQNWNGIGGN